MTDQLQNSYGPDSPSVTSHLTIVQSIIGRMAGNSASCKIQCVVLVTGIMVVAAQSGTSGYAALALIPTGIFLLLDAHYLALERIFRDSYNGFVRKLHQHEVVLSDLYKVRPGKTGIRNMLISLRSTSIWPFYGVLAVTSVLVWQLVSVKSLLGF